MEIANSSDPNQKSYKCKGMATVLGCLDKITPCFHSWVFLEGLRD